MSVIGEFTVPSSSFLLEESLAEVPEMVVEVQRVVAQSAESLIPYFWVHHGDKDEFDAAIRNDSTLADVTLLDEFERGTSYRGTWTGHAEGIAYAYTDTGATILEATGQGETWTLRMHFDDDEGMTDFHQYCGRKDIPFTLDRLYHPSEPMAGGQYGLTPTQRETLVTAFRSGYYTVPRTRNMSELAEELGTSQQALSKNFRRAHASLIENTLVVSEEESMTTSETDPR